MAQDFSTPSPPPLEPPRRRSNVWTVVLIVIVVLLCCCVLIGGLGWYLWTYGDQIFGLSQSMVNLLI
jgi:nitrate reductase NapE component